MERLRRVSRSYCVFRPVVLALAFLQCAGAQVRTTGEIRGTVLDPTSASIAGVVLTAKDVATGNATSGKSGQDGGYLFLNLQPGTYELAASAPGFQAVTMSGVVVETARTTNLDIRLSVGSVTESIQVIAESQVLETTTNMVSTT
ncbi:MAG: carboxypeptidase-like regulatory domain-containing protein, partial [Bryobacteraceae bacterium]